MDILFEIASRYQGLVPEDNPLRKSVILAKENIPGIYRNTLERILDRLDSSQPFSQIIRDEHLLSDPAFLSLFYASESRNILDRALISYYNWVLWKDFLAERLRSSMLSMLKLAGLFILFLYLFFLLVFPVVHTFFDSLNIDYGHGFRILHSIRLLLAYPSVIIIILSLFSAAVILTARYTGGKSRFLKSTADLKALSMLYDVTGENNAGDIFEKYLTVPEDQIKAITSRPCLFYDKTRTESLLEKRLEKFDRNVRKYSIISNILLFILICTVFILLACIIGNPILRVFNRSLSMI